MLANVNLLPSGPTAQVTVLNLDIGGGGGILRVGQSRYRLLQYIFCGAEFGQLGYTSVVMPLVLCVTRTIGVLIVDVWVGLKQSENVNETLYNILHHQFTVKIRAHFLFTRGKYGS